MPVSIKAAKEFVAKFTEIATCKTTPREGGFGTNAKLIAFVAQELLTTELEGYNDGRLDGFVDGYEQGQRDVANERMQIRFDNTQPF